MDSGFCQLSISLFARNSVLPFSVLPSSSGRNPCVSVLLLIRLFHTGFYCHNMVCYFSGNWYKSCNHFGTQVIACYASLIQEAFEQHDSPTESERAAQLAYHTLYLFQVLTLDRGTTSGLLVHSQNDLGIMGSLPARADRALLASWRGKVPAVQMALVDDLVDALTDVSPSPIDADAKLRLAQAVRAHYQAHPEALALQASGNVVPPTVDNHK